MTASVNGRKRALPAVPAGRRTWRLVGLCLFTLWASADDWPQWMGPRRDGVWRESGILQRFPAAGPQVRWRTAVGGGFAGPAVSQGRVYVLDRQLANHADQPTKPFERGRILGTERVLCLKEDSGEILWQHADDCAYTVSYPSGPRTTPTVDGDRVFTLGAEGHLLCLEAASGKVMWSRELTRDYPVKTPMWGFAGHPLVDGRKLICLVGGPGSVLVAFDKGTGKELWRGLTAKEPGYAPPVIYEFGGRRELIIWHPEAVNGLDPETGRVLWSHPVEARLGLSIAMPRQDGDRLLVTSFYNGALMLKIEGDSPAVVWKSHKVSERDTDGLHSIIPTPSIADGCIYGVCSYGEFRCLRSATGERLWETFAPTTGVSTRWGNAFLVRQADRWFLFNEQGDLIIARLSPAGYEELSRARLLEPTNPDPGRPVVWSHPAFANRCVYARNDREIVCVKLSEE